MPDGSIQLPHKVRGMMDGWKNMFSGLQTDFIGNAVPLKYFVCSQSHRHHFNIPYFNYNVLISIIVLIIIIAQMSLKTCCSENRRFLDHTVL